MNSAALARCDREQAEIQARPELATAPAYLVALGMEDWEYEKRLIEKESA